MYTRIASVMVVVVISMGVVVEIVWSANETTLVSACLERASEQIDDDYDDDDGPGSNADGEIYMAIFGRTHTELHRFVSVYVYLLSTSDFNWKMKLKLDESIL